MRLRYALTVALLAGAVTAVAVAFDLDRRLADAAAAPDAVAAASFYAVGPVQVIVLVALATLDLAALLLLTGALREERAHALLGTSAPAPAPVRPEAPALEEDAAGLGAPSAVTETWRAEAWGALAAWTPEQARPCFDLWSRLCAPGQAGWPREWEDFEKFFGAPEFDPEASAVARAPDGTLIGLALGLRQPALEDDRHWWLEAPGVLAAVLVDPAHRRQGVGRALARYAEQAARRRKRPRLFIGGLEHFPQLVPGVPDQDYVARMFCLALGFHEVRRTCHMEVECGAFQAPAELVERETKLAGQGFAFVPGRPEDREAFAAFLRNAGLDRPQRREEKFAQDPACFLFAWKEQHIAGFVLVRPKDARGQSALDTIFFPREFRGMGLGSLLLIKAHVLWKAQGAARASLWTYPEAAARFYPRAGFRTVQEWVCYERELDHSWDDPEYVQRWR